MKKDRKNNNWRKGKDARRQGFSFTIVKTLKYSIVKMLCNIFKNLNFIFIFFTVHTTIWMLISPTAPPPIPRRNVYFIQNEQCYSYLSFSWNIASAVSSIPVMSPSWSMSIRPTRLCINLHLRWILLYPYTVLQRGL